MKRLKIIVALLLLILVLMFNVDNAYDETPIVPEVVEEEPSLEQIWRDMIVEKVDNLLGDYISSEIIVDNCMEKTENYILCIKNVVGVANAESSLFKRMNKKNNPFWLMKGWRLQKFDSKYDAIEYRIDLYQEKWWYKRTSWAAWLEWNYCASECSYRISNYNAAINKLSFS